MRAGFAALRTFDFGAALRGLAAFAATRLAATFADFLDVLPAIVFTRRCLSMHLCKQGLIRADAHRRLNRVIPNEKLGQRQRVALGAVGDVDATDLVTQVSGLRNEVP